MKKMIGLCVIQSLCACTRPDAAKDLLTSQGYKDVTTTGYSFFACSQDDSFATGFKATSPTGQHVSGTVCSGLMKGSTVRFD